MNDRRFEMSVINDCKAAINRCDDYDQLVEEIDSSLYRNTGYEWVVIVHNKNTSYSVDDCDRFEIDFGNLKIRAYLPV